MTDGKVDFFCVPADTIDALTNRHSAAAVNKFGRALSTAALLTSIHELQATDGSDDIDLVLGFDLLGEFISRCAKRRASRRKIPRNGME